jgi:hypothetical protein
MTVASRIALGLLSVVLVALMVGGATIPNPPASPGRAANAGVSPAVVGGPTCATTVNVTGGGHHSTAVLWGCKMNAVTAGGAYLPSHGWANRVFELNCLSGCNVNVTVLANGGFGDYFSLWYTPDPSLQTSWARLGGTPQVYTGPQLLASTYNPHWNGYGITSSQRTFAFYAPPGIPEFLGVHDDLFSQMTQKLDGPCGVSSSSLLTSGCSTSGIWVGSHWSGSTFASTWS